MYEKIIKQNDPIWKAIETGGHAIDIIRIIEELDKAGYYIISKIDYACWFSGEKVKMKAEYTK